MVEATPPDTSCALEPIMKILDEQTYIDGDVDLSTKLRDFVKNALEWKLMVDSLAQQSTEVETKVVELEDRIDARLARIEATIAALSEPKAAKPAKGETYAEKAKRVPTAERPKPRDKPTKQGKPATPKTEHLVLIKPVNPGEKKALGSKQELRKLIGKEMPNVVRVHVGKGGLLKYSCETADGKETLRTLVREKGTEAFSVVEPTRLWPRLRLLGCLDEKKEDWPSVLGDILDKNAGLKESLDEAVGNADGGLQTALKAVSVLRIRGVLTWVLESSPAVRKVLLGWDKVGYGKGKVFLSGAVGRIAGSRLGPSVLRKMLLAQPS